MINLRVSLLALALLGSTGWANAQSIAEDIVMDQHAPVDEPLEKAIDYFTAPDFPSVMVGNGGSQPPAYEPVSMTEKTD